MFLSFHSAYYSFSKLTIQLINDILSLFFQFIIFCLHKYDNLSVIEQTQSISTNIRFCVFFKHLQVFYFRTDSVIWNIVFFVSYCLLYKITSQPNRLLVVKIFNFFICFLSTLQFVCKTNCHFYLSKCCQNF